MGKADPPSQHKPAHMHEAAFAGKRRQAGLKGKTHDQWAAGTQPKGMAHKMIIIMSVINTLPSSFQYKSFAEIEAVCNLHVSLGLQCDFY